jgi:hypothetical protein
VTGAQRSRVAHRMTSRTDARCLAAALRLAITPRHRPACPAPTLDAASSYPRRRYSVRSDLLRAFVGRVLHARSVALATGTAVGAADDERAAGRAAVARPRARACLDVRRDFATSPSPRWRATTAGCGVRGTPSTSTGRLGGRSASLQRRAACRPPRARTSRREDVRTRPSHRGRVNPRRRRGDARGHLRTISAARSR